MTTPAPVGMVVAEGEYELVSRGLVALAEEARRNGQTDVYSALKRFVVRLKQHVFAGSGIPEETLQRMTTVIEENFALQNYEGARIATAALLAAVVRMDPDPAHVIALQLAPSFVKLTAAAATHHQFMIAAKAMTKLSQQLESERAAFGSGGWSDPEATFDYVRELVDFYAAEFSNGVDPFEDAPEST